MAIDGWDLSGLGDIDRYPGGDLVRQGLADLAAGRETPEALLVAVGAARLRAAGVPVPALGILDPELRLYEQLARDDPDAAHGRYNALIRKLASFERAIEAVTARATAS
jgi:hypothetical protein